MLLVDCEKLLIIPIEFRFYTLPESVRQLQYDEQAIDSTVI